MEDPKFYIDELTPPPNEPAKARKNRHDRRAQKARVRRAKRGFERAKKDVDRRLAAMGIR